jgi:hypothetical protein
MRIDPAWPAPREGLGRHVSRTLLLACGLLASCVGRPDSFPVVSFFTASPNIIAPGGASALAWSVSGASTIDIQADPADSTLSAGPWVATTTTVNPTVTTTYTLTARSDAGTTTTVQVQVVVTDLPIISYLTATPAVVDPNQQQSSTLAWSVSNASAVTIVPDAPAGALDTTGTLAVTPSSTTTYRITATNAVGSQSQEITVKALPLVSLAASPTTVDPSKGESSTLSWTVSNADTVAITPDLGVGTLSASGSAAVTPTGTTTYTLQATNAVGPVTTTVTVKTLNAVSGVISGAVADGVVVTLSGPASATATTAGGGRYAFSGLANGTYTLTPRKAGYSFAPQSLTVTIADDYVTGRSFTARPAVCSADGWCWQNPLPQGNDLFGVWGSGPHDVWAVGASGTILHWDGSAWSGTPSGTTEEIRAVWGSGPNDVWAVGGPAFSDPHPAPSTILHWDGTAWSNSTSPAGSLRAIWGSGANDVWAVGDAGTTLHWDGTAWTSVGAPFDFRFTLQGVWGSGPDDVWVVGGNQLGRWDGQTWTLSFTSNGYSGIGGSGPGDVWAAGSNPGLGNGVVDHWTGTGWSSSTTSSFGLRKIRATGANDIWALGEGTVLHWNGSSWLSRAISGSGILSDVWGSGANDVWAVGSGGAILHWDGATWSAPNSTKPLTSLWGSGANDVWAVGGTGTILHWDGSSWSAATSGTTSDLQGVWGSSANDVWAVGSNGALVHWNGTIWSASTSPLGGNLYAVWGSGPNDVWAIGDVGTAVHWNGTAWSDATSLISQQPGTIRGIWGDSADDAWMVGAGVSGPSGNIMRRGVLDMWGSVQVLSSSDFNGVWGSGANDVWAVGNGGTIARWNGLIWSVGTSDTTSPTTGDLLSVWGSGPDDVWATVRFGFMIHWDGHAWSSVDGPSGFGAVWGSDAGHVWAAGALGAILQRAP